MPKIRQLDTAQVEPEHHKQWHPTRTLIGSRERVEVYAIRAERGDLIHHPQDNWQRIAPPYSGHYEPGVRKMEDLR